MASQTVWVRITLFLVRFLLWGYRKIGPSDFVTAMLLFSLLLVSSILSVAFYIPVISNFFVLIPYFQEGTEIFQTVVGFIAGGFGILYVYRLRMVGIVSIDASPESGLDYKSALGKVAQGFDFLGIGAAKLTSNQTEFKAAIARISQHQKRARILLCDPRSHAIERLEMNAGVDVGQYRANVKQSFTRLEQLQARFGALLEIRLYRPEDIGCLPPFRLMFINEEICLVSQVVVGAEKEGRLLPQIHIEKRSMLALTPNLYRAFEVSFEQLWGDAKPVSADDFRSISQINVTSAGAHAHV